MVQKAGFWESIWNVIRHQGFIGTVKGLLVLGPLITFLWWAKGPIKTVTTEFEAWTQFRQEMTENHKLELQLVQAQGKQITDILDRVRIMEKILLQRKR